MNPTQPSIATDLYRVREPDWSEVWGENLTRAEAQKLKDQIVSVRRKSRVTTIRPMSEEVPDWYRETQESLSAAQELLGEAPETPGSCSSEATRTAPPAPVAPVGTQYDIAGPVKAVIPHDGTVVKIPAGHHLMVNGQERPVPCRVAKGEQIECRSMNPQLASVRSVADHAVAQVIRDKRRYVDVTVRKPTPRKRPPPPDVTVKHQKVVRLGTLPQKPAERFMAPWKAAELKDGDELPENAITDDDLVDLSADLGGAETAADVEHAKREAEKNAG